MKRLAASVFVLSVLAAPASAQDDLLGQCAPAALTITTTPSTPVPSEIGQQVGFVCSQVVNAMTNVQRSVGIAFSGGAHTLGTASTIGRRLGLFPRVAVTARANFAFAETPDLLDGFAPAIGQDGTVAAMGSSGFPLAALQGDVTVGLFNGIAAGPTFGGLGAIDLLGSVSYVPNRDEIGLSEEIITAGIGARIGIIKQGLVMPGVSVSAMYRTTLDEVQFGSLTEGDPAQFGTDLSTVSFRAGISKGILMFDLAAGAGYDIYNSDVAFDFELDCPASQCGQDVTLGVEPIEGELSTAAWNLYANAGVSLLLVNIVGELGYQKATDVIDLDSLGGVSGLPSDQPLTQDDLEGGRFFGSIGIRLTL